MVKAKKPEKASSLLLKLKTLYHEKLEPYEQGLVRDLYVQLEPVPIAIEDKLESTKQELENLFSDFKKDADDLLDQRTM